MMKTIIWHIAPAAGLASLLFILNCAAERQSPRSVQNFGSNWTFHLGDVDGAQTPEFDDSGWRALDLPHDWSIEGDFNSGHPATPGGGALPGGIGWYRKSFTLPETDSGKVTFIDFDGVYMNSTVWINGHCLGLRPYGYISFRYELTPHLKFGGEANVLAVRVDNSLQPNSRWYSGSGIYRNVWLVTTGTIHVDYNGTYVTTPGMTEGAATVSIKTQIANSRNEDVVIDLSTLILDGDGGTAADVSSELELPAGGTTEAVQELKVENPLFWDLDSPALYTAVTRIRTGSNLIDEVQTRFGIRSFEFDEEKGFILNGKAVKILGVCNHHDLGCLGAAVNTRALERQLEILKEMGCNGIRTAHNPPAPELLDLCDRMGFVVMDEAFDMWKKKKTEYDYSLYYDEWHRRDLEDFIRRDRNHPSVFLWSIGNEILEQWDESGIAMAQELVALVRELDPTRPVTSGCNDPRPHNYIIRSGILDLIGYNYHHQDFEAFPKTFPGSRFIASETGSAIATRGKYDMPSDVIRRWPVRGGYEGPPPNADYTCSAYDNCCVPWGSTHEETWSVMKKHAFLTGMFYWTGFDYLGEPTPYGWPARSSYFGIVDLAGFPKDAYWFYKSEWTDEPVLHLFPHWNWKEGESVDVWVYTNYNEVELLLNGVSLGTKPKTENDLHLMWRVAFAPGTIKAVARRKDGRTKTCEIHTAGPAAALELKADRPVIRADGEDLCFVTVNVLDRDGNPVPRADDRVRFETAGPGSIAAVDNGNPVSHEPFKAQQRRAFNGKCLAVVKSTREAGTIKLTATAEGLEPAAVEIRAR